MSVKKNINMKYKIQIKILEKILNVNVVLKKVNSVKSAQEKKLRIMVEKILKRVIKLVNKI